MWNYLLLLLSGVSDVELLDDNIVIYLPQYDKLSYNLQPNTVKLSM